VANPSQAYDAYNFGSPGTWSANIAPVPEPSSLAMAGFGGLSLLALLRRK
jgi:hypothetical protein